MFLIQNQIWLPSNCIPTKSFTKNLIIHGLDTIEYGSTVAGDHQQVCSKATGYL
jgi:hypothetical protein